MATHLPTGTVSFLFTDVEGSTRRWEADAAAMANAMSIHDTVVRAAIEANGGSVFTTAGDAFCAAFSTPQKAVLAAIDAQIGLANASWQRADPVRVRMAVHSGHADERDGDYFGPSLNRCARLLSTGSGGQVLISSATSEMLLDNPVAGVGLKDLGSHKLKDLERLEHIYQLSHPELESEFPPLRAESVVLEAADMVAEGRQAFAANDWSRAYQSLDTASRTIELDAEDLARLGEAAWWTGRSDEGLRIRERAYQAFAREGKTDAAALVALALAESHHYRLAESVANAWAARAERLLADSPNESAARGYLLRYQAVEAFEREGRPDKGLELAERVIAIATKLGEQNLEALGLLDKGRILVSQGNIDEGMALMDEAMLAAVSGELSPQATGRAYCNMLSVCDDVADYKRAVEWSDAAETWCEQYADSGYPGICRIFRAELKWRRGHWEDAGTDLDLAMTELTGFTTIIGAALYVKGVVELRSGNLEEAADQFRSANEHGYRPLPGLAELRLRQGELAAAEELLRAALAEATGPLQRAKYLPTYIDASFALNDLVAVTSALEELEEVAELVGSDALRAAAEQRRGMLDLQSGDPDSAVRRLEGVTQTFGSLGMPYESARARTLVAEAQRARGNNSAAAMELESAKAAFVKLGAQADLDALT